MRSHERWMFRGGRSNPGCLARGSTSVSVSWSPIQLIAAKRTMADCSEQSRLEAYHDDEQSDADRAAFEAHLRACPSCAAELKALRAASNPLREFRTERLSEISL